MTRELKLALVVGVMLVLVVAMLVADHVRPRSDTLAAARGDQGTLAYTGAEYGQADPLALVPGQPLVESQPKAESRQNHRPEAKPIGPGTRHVSDTGTQGTPIGEFVKIDQGSVKTSDASGGREEQAADAGLPIAGPDLKYTVDEGDTFYGLAKRFYRDGGLAAKLESYNKSRLTKQGQLRIGSTVLIPAREVLEGKAISGSDAAAKSNPAPGATPGAGDPNSNATGPRSMPLAETTTVNYTIRPGDTLIAVARDRLKSASRLREILDLNPRLRGNESSLAVGTVIKLPKE